MSIRSLLSWGNVANHSGRKDLAVKQAQILTIRVAALIYYYLVKKSL